jgi:FKBP-type peptidyl-prolyl cis-trans isomerase FklB
MDGLMKLFVMAAMLGVMGCAGLALGEAAATMPATAPASASAFKTDAEKIGYAVGLQIGGRLKGVDVSGKALADGVYDSSVGNPPKMTDEEIRAAIEMLQGKLQAQAMQAGAASSKAGEAFLAENAKKPGVVTTASGLQYKVNSSGKGKMPKATDTVSVNYKGTLISGKVFDESHGEPATFPVNGVIPGWTEALQLMKEGDKWTLYIPAKLAYGENSPSPDIGPNEVLVFEVELVAVK